MIKNIFVIFILSNMLNITLLAQSDTTFNQFNEKGLKQGFWKKNFPNGKLMYRGYFIDDKPVGEMKRCYESGSIRAIMVFDTNTPYVAIKQYYEDGELSSEGFYYETLKDSIWKYYSYYTGTLVSEESYVKGVKHGIEKIFYENGQVSEEIEWKNNIKDGIWNQYFEDGKDKSGASFALNQLNGKYVAFYADGALMVLGYFFDNKRHGTWKFYNEDGTLKYEIKYNNGIAENEEVIEERDDEFFKMIEENIGKYSDPTIDDIMPGGGF